MQNDRAIVQTIAPRGKNESPAIVLLCTHREGVGAFFYTLFLLIFVAKAAVTARKGKTAYSQVHSKFRIRILQEHKEKD